MSVTIQERYYGTKMTTFIEKQKREKKYWDYHPHPKSASYYSFVD